MKIIFKLLNYSSWVFILGLIVITVIDTLLIGEIPDFKSTEYSGPPAIRWIVVAILYLSVMMTILSVLFNLIFYFRKSKFLEYLNISVFLSGIILLFWIVFLNPFHLFTWLMG